MSERQRQHPRISLPRVLVRIGRSHTLRQHFLEDLAEGGLFVRTHHLLPIGSELDLSLTVPGQAAPLELRGRVVRVNAGTDGPEADLSEPVGMGIRFESLSPAARERLLVLLAEHSMTPALVAELGRLKDQVHSLEIEVAEAPDGSLGKALRTRLLSSFAAVGVDLGTLQRAVEGLSRRLDQAALERQRMESELAALRADAARGPSGETAEIQVEDSWHERQQAPVPGAPDVESLPLAPVTSVEDEDTWVEVFTYDQVPTEDFSGPRPVRVEDWKDALDELEPPPVVRSSEVPFPLRQSPVSAPRLVSIAADEEASLPEIVTVSEPDPLPWELPEAEAFEQIEVDLSSLASEPKAPPTLELVREPGATQTGKRGIAPEAFAAWFRAGNRVERTPRFHLYTPTESLALRVMGWLESADTFPALRACAAGRLSDDTLVAVVYELYKLGLVALSPNRRTGP